MATPNTLTYKGKKYNFLQTTPKKEVIQKVEKTAKSGKNALNSKLDVHVVEDVTEITQDVHQTDKNGTPLFTTSKKKKRKPVIKKEVVRTDTTYHIYIRKV